MQSRVQGQNQPGFHVPAKRQTKSCTQCRCCRDLGQRPGNRNGFHREKIFKGEVKPNAEHQQNNANFSQLENEFLIGNETGCMRASDDTSKQIADKGEILRRVAMVPKIKARHNPMTIVAIKGVSWGIGMPSRSSVL